MNTPSQQPDLSAVNDKTATLTQLNHQHVWHPFTPMRQWREQIPTIIERAEGMYLYDTEGNRYLDGVSSIWCNVHGHHVKELDNAIRDQLDKVAHTTMLGLANVPATQLAEKLIQQAKQINPDHPDPLNKVFYTDAGATATEVAFKMAVGYHYHHGNPNRTTLIAIQGAYHGDTMGAMSVGYSPTFHQPFEQLIFKTIHTASPDVFHSTGPNELDADGQRIWSTENQSRNQQVCETSLQSLRETLEQHPDQVAAIVIEPIIQGAAGILTHPAGFLQGVRELADEFGVLLIADEVAVGFGRTGTMFACQNENVMPDIMCLGKGLTAGYLPLAATLATDRVEQAFTGEVHQHRTLYHGHTFTGNPLASAVAIKSLELFEENKLLADINRKAKHVAEKLNVLRDPERFPTVGDVRQKGLMIGIELVPPGTEPGTGFDPSRKIGQQVCAAAREQGVFVRPLGNVVVIMPPLAIPDTELDLLIDTVIESIESHTRV